MIFISATTKIHRRYGRTILTFTADNTVTPETADNFTKAAEIYETAVQNCASYCEKITDVISESARQNGMRRFVTSHARLGIHPVKAANNEVKIKLTAAFPERDVHTELHTWRLMRGEWLMTKRENLHTADNNL